MAKTVVLNIKVNDAELQELEKGLNELGADFKVVEREAGKTDHALKKVGDNGGAIATLDALTGGLATRIRDAAEASKLFGTQFKAALIATGIGALVVALGLVVAYWEEIVDYITDANESLEEQLHLAETKVSVIEAELALLDRQIELNKEQNKNAQELIDKKKELLNFQLQELQLQKLILEEQYAQEAAEARRATFWESILGRGAQVTAEEMANLSEIEKQILQTELQLLNVQNLLANGGEKSGSGSTKRDKVDKIDPITGIVYGDKNEQEKLNKNFEDLFEIRKTWQERQLEISNEFANSEIAITARRELAKREYEKMSAAERERIAEEEAKAKMMLYDATAAAFANASQLIGQETASGKALAVASSLISTYAAIANTLKAFSGVPIPGYAIAQSVATGLAGFAAVRNILATNIPGGYGGGITAPTTPPAFNVVGTSPQNQLNQALLQQNNEPVQAFVVAGEVTTAQQMQRNRVSASSLG